MSYLEIAFKLVILCGGGFLALVFLAIAWRLIRTSPNQYKKLQKNSPSFWETILGCGSKLVSQTNHRQRVFPVVNLQTNQWEVRASLNESSLDEFLKG